MSYAIIWFRRDLRLDDNPALQAALEAGHVPIPLYIHAPDEAGEWAPGAASSAWLHHSLAALDQQLRQRGSRLLLRQGRSQEVVQQLLQQTGASAVYWNRRYEPATVQRDTGIKLQLRQDGLDVRSFNASLMLEPWQLATGQGTPYRVFTPFWRNALTRLQPPLPLPAPKQLPPLPDDLASEELQALQLSPALGWDHGFWEHWQPGSDGAAELLEAFVEGALQGYREGRDRPDHTGTSRLSPHLHFGEISPWQIWRALEGVRCAANSADIDSYQRELGWREFAHHILHHFPETPNHNFDKRMDHFEWAADNPELLQAWQQGRTGIPIVDAGMRELWHTGYMHNRVRMLVASLLCKQARQHWRHGARWFWDTLVDADLANNSMGWQWVAGTGADAAPYFRIFNPVTQAKKFDREARYISRWLPELQALPVAMRFAPWEHPQALAELAPDYPQRPLLDLAEGRERALEAHSRLRGKS